MKKNLQNAMAKNFQKMVNEQPTQEVSNKKSENTTPKKETTKSQIKEAEKVEKIADVINESEEIPEKIEPIQKEATITAAPTQVVTPVNIVPVQQSVPMQQPIPEPIMQPIAPQVQPIQQQTIPVQQQAAPIYYQNPIMTQQVQEMPYTTPIPATVNEMPQTAAKSNMKKSIPLVPEEKSSGVLHIRLGELRSYVDFMTQSGKMSYQQYISNLIEQDYEKNKDLYIKYKSFMDQLNM